MLDAEQFMLVKKKFKHQKFYPNFNSGEKLRPDLNGALFENFGVEKALGNLQKSGSGKRESRPNKDEKPVMSNE